MIEPIKINDKPMFGKIVETHRTNNTEDYKIKFTQQEVFTNEEGVFTITQTWEPKVGNNLDVKG